MQKKFRSLFLFILWLCAASCAIDQPTTEHPLSPGHTAAAALTPTESRALPAATEPPVATATPHPLPTAETSTEPAPPSIGEIIASLEGLPFDQFLAESYRQLQLRDPDQLIYNGFADLYGVTISDQFTNLSADYLRETGQLESGILDLLQNYNREALSPGQQISRDSYAWYLEMQVRGQAFGDFKFLVNPVWGLQNWPTDFLKELPLESRQDAETYIARLSNLDTWMEQVIAGLARNEQAGAIPPKFVVEATIAQIDAILNPNEAASPDAGQIEVYTHFHAKITQVGDLSADEKEALLEAARAGVEATFIPAYQALRDQLARLSAIAEPDPNRWKLPGGEAYYAYLLEYYTGTNLSAGELHALGLAEVARIQAGLWEAAAGLGYPADTGMSGLTQRLNEESQVITGEALLHKYEQILAAADQASQDYFGLRTTAGVEIQPVLEGPPAFYIAPPPGSDRPGEMPVNLEVSPLWVNYNEFVLLHHETIPGHHIQLALAQELELPGFQRYFSTHPYLQNYAFQAYPEGWALYAETLAWEMGLYEGEPLANLGRLRLKLLRTARLVADTGLHVQGWTLAEAAAYLEEVTGMPQNETRLTRYLVNPGYDTGYNLGGLEITAMRQRAMDQLGADFDIKEFHNTVLGHGIVPIWVLDQIVDDWIAARLNP